MRLLSHNDFWKGLYSPYFKVNEILQDFRCNNLKISLNVPGLSPNIIVTEDSTVEYSMGWRFFDSINQDLRHYFNKIWC